MKNFKRRNQDDRRDFGGRGSSRPGMHSATCAECGQACEVPFRPTGDKPVYCSDCFGRNKNSGFGRSGGRDDSRRNFRDKQMFDAICDKCGKNCEVPFRPSGDKPVLCRECFGQSRSDGGKKIGPTKEQFEIINSKLDKILGALNPQVKEATEIKTEKAALVSVEKKVESKRALKKAEPEKIASKKAVKKRGAAVVLPKAKKKKR